MRLILPPYLRICVAIALLASCSATQSFASEGQALAVITSPEQTLKSLSKSELSLIFWRKKLFWPNHKRIRPVNFNSDHPARQAFSIRVLNSLPESQTDYWNGLYYHGVSPPHVVHSTEAMLRTVAETAGAIGYVDVCDVDARVKAVAWIDAEGHLSSEPVQADCLKN